MATVLPPTTQPSATDAIADVSSLPPSGTPEPVLPTVLPPTTQPSLTDAILSVGFDSLGEGSSTTVRLIEPGVFVAGSVSEADRFTRWLKPNVATRIQEVDFNNVLVVAVFSGSKPSSGFGVTIQEVNTGPGTVRLTVSITDPIPGRAVSDVVTYPYHIIRLPRQAVGVAPGANWIVQTLDGTQIAQIRY